MSVIAFVERIACFGSFPAAKHFDQIARGGQGSQILGRND